MSNINDSYEKTKGYFIWDILKSISIIIKNILNSVQEVANSLDINNLHGDYLDIFIKDRTGLLRKEANFSEGILNIEGNGTIEEGSIFETEGLIRFRAVETKKIINSGNIKIKAELSGNIGNVPANTITKIPITIDGIIKCYNSLPTTEGYEEESDEDFIQRYYEHLQMPATSGNIYHYILWAKEITGVGAAKCFPLWNGDNTVKVIIINSERLPASSKLVEEVQNYIDPNISGKGDGTAPIGAFCTVESAKEKLLNINVKLKITPNYNLDLIKSSIIENLNNHLKEIAFQQNYVSYAHIGAIILKSEGVIDYSELKIGNRELLQYNMYCNDDEVIILGDVIISII